MFFYNQRDNICRFFYSPPTVLHYNHLYGLGNNYIYKVNKDKIKGKYMENRNNMNIKERIVYKRLEREGKRIEKAIASSASRSYV